MTKKKNCRYVIIDCLKGRVDADNNCKEQKGVSQKDKMVK